MRDRTDGNSRYERRERLSVAFIAIEPPPPHLMSHNGQGARPMTKINHRASRVRTRAKNVHCAGEMIYYRPGEPKEIQTKTKGDASS